MSEYLLLIIYIVITVHDMLRLRKARKTLPKRTSSIIKYRYEKITPFPSESQSSLSPSSARQIRESPTQSSPNKKTILLTRRFNPLLFKDQHHATRPNREPVLSPDIQPDPSTVTAQTHSKVKTILNRLKHTPGEGVEPPVTKQVFQPSAEERPVPKKFAHAYAKKHL